MPGDPTFESQGHEPNFRQVGTRATQGRLLMGTATAHSGTAPTSSSIPSKFETILYQGDTESDGFNTRTARFKPVVRDLPGPGAYHKETDMNIKSDSISKKGYGNGFVSKADRFRYIDAGGAPAYFPGPGSYEMKKVDQTRWKDFNRSETTSGYKHFESKPLVPINRYVPGPGAYSADAMKRKRRNRAARLPEGHSMAVRKSGGDADGEGQGDVRTNFGPQGGGSLNGTFERENNQNFGSTTARFTTAENDNPPPGAYKPELAQKWLKADEVSASFKSATVRNIIDTTTHMDEPGPGHFYPHEAEEIDRVTKDDAGWQAFKITQDTRFGVPKQRRKAVEVTPAPGQYDPVQDKYMNRNFDIQNQKDHRYEPVIQAFGSTLSEGINLGYTNATKNRHSGRPLVRTTASISAALQKDIMATSNIRPPGPAYYNPDSMGVKDKKSYILNSKNRWL